MRTATRSGFFISLDGVVFLGGAHTVALGFPAGLWGSSDSAIFGEDVAGLGLLGSGFDFFGFSWETG